MFKAAILDGISIVQSDLSWEPVGRLCSFTVYDRTSPHELEERIKNLDGFFTSKCKITEELMKKSPKLKFIGVTATGFDNVDVKAAESLGIAVCHVPAYSTDAVAQHVFALILEIENRTGYYGAQVASGRWQNCKDFTFFDLPTHTLSGMSLGIVGYGSIGKQVARIAEAFGMTVNIYSRNRDAALKSDILTLHCPLTAENEGFVNADFISEMKDGAVLINTARGKLVNEEDLAAALKSGKLSFAALDVLSVEPPERDNPLIGLDNCIITPHIAWMPRECRERVVDTCAANLKSFLDGGSLNRVDKIR